MRPVRTPHDISRALLIPQSTCKIEIFTYSSSQRGNVHRAEDSHLHHTFAKLLLSVVSPPFCRLDKTIQHCSPRVGMLTDLPRSKSQLMAENALLRKPLILLRRQVKRPACTRTDRMRARATGKHGSNMEASAFHHPARDTPAVASPGI